MSLGLQVSGDRSYLRGEEWGGEEIRGNFSVSRQGITGNLFSMGPNGGGR